jgi:hypothetical protein
VFACIGGLQKSGLGEKGQQTMVGGLVRGKTATDLGRWIVVLLLLTACSMQKSGTSKLESARTEKSDQILLNHERQEAQDKLPLRVDYLTPISAIHKPEIFVYKEKRRLYVIHANALVRDYPIGLGFQPRGDKEKDGDGRTPEGDFLICVKDGSSRFQKSLGLNYPDKKHGERAFFAGVITPSEFKDIALSFENRSVPPWNTRIGGKVFIHAGGAHKDWTDGSVALYDSDMEELFQIATVGTPVIVRP